MSPDSMIEDSPLTVGSWQPKNYGGRYRGRISLREAFAVSSNVAAVRLSERVGRANVIRAARDLGVTSPLADSPSLALGTSGITLLEMTSAYAAVAAGAYPVRPKGLAPGPQPWWQRAWSSVADTSGDGAFPELKELLFAAVNEGTGRAAALEVPSFGKTGTTQDNRDAIFIGFAGDLIVGVWVGKDDNSPLGQVAGGGLPARIWRDFMASAVGSKPRAPVRAITPRATEAPRPTITRDGITVPIDGTGYEVGVRFGNESLTVSAQPSPGDNAPETPRDGPAAALPPPVAEDIPEPDEGQ